MVRINLINPKKLSDQHLIAEYNEILMLIGYVRKFPDIPEDISRDYLLGKGHMIFFKNKIKYLKNRHELIKKEMKKRGFKTNKTIILSEFKKNQKNDWKPGNKDKQIIKKRIIKKIKLKPEYYKYYGEKKGKGFFIKMLS